MISNQPKHIYFASDFHLGVPNFEDSLKREKLLCLWLDSIKSQVSELYLLGDLFDFWFEYKDVVPKGYTRFLGKLSELSDNGVKITLFKGNHDMWTFGYLEKEIGLTVISDELVIERNAKKIFMHHGDGIGPGDKMYKLIRKLFRSYWAIKLFAFLHPRIGAGLAKYLSKSSRIQKEQTGADKNYLGDDKEFITQFCLEHLKHQHIDYFVCGHRHLPLNIELSNNSRYINLGEWVNYFTYAVFDGNNMELKKFEV